MNSNIDKNTNKNKNVLVKNVLVKNVLVFVEQNEGKIAEVSIELICEAKRLASKLNVGVDAVVLGCDLKDKLDILGHYGADRIIYHNNEKLAHFTSVPYAKLIVATIKKYNPQIVLYGASTTGRDVAPRVSSELKCGLTADCTELEIGDYEYKNQVYKNILLQNRPAFGGNIVATIVSPESSPSMATVREGVMKLDVPDTKRKAELIIENIKIEDSWLMTEVMQVIRETKSVDLKGASIVVAAGMGAENPGTFKLVEELAKVIGGKVASTRPLVDVGVIARDHQVGQTGVTVRPNLYIACGISGQIQHRAGMQESKRIIAINNDPNAPIFKIAHYGIVGDLNDVLPKMIRAYKEKA